MLRHPNYPGIVVVVAHYRALWSERDIVTHGIRVFHYLVEEEKQCKSHEIVLYASIRHATARTRVGIMTEKELMVTDSVTDTLSMNALVCEFIQWNHEQQQQDRTLISVLVKTSTEAIQGIIQCSFAISHYKTYFYVPSLSS